MAAYEDMAKLYDGANAEPDPKVEAQAEAVAKKNGFANLDEYDDVSLNIEMIVSGIDRQTKKFTEPSETDQEGDRSAQGRQIICRQGPVWPCFQECSLLQCNIKGVSPHNFQV
jgi:hypothetical protein